VNKHPFELKESIRTKLMMVGLAATATALILAGVASFLADYQLDKQSLIHRLETETGIIGANCTAALAFGDRQGAEEILSYLKSLASVEMAVVYGRNGSPLALYYRSGAGNVPPPVQTDGTAFGFGTIETFRTIVHDGEPVGTIYLRANTGELNRRARGFILSLLISIMGAMGLAWLMLSKLQKVITRPVLELAQQMREVSEGKDYSIRAEIKSNDEFGLLTLGFNEMIEQLQKHQEELQSARISLEQLVTVRTEDLARANEALGRELEERMRAQRALMGAAQEWRETFDAISDQVSLLNREGKILRVNKAVQRALNIPFDKIVNRNTCELMHTHGPDLARCPFHQASATLSSHTIDMQRGSRWYTVTVDPIMSETGRLTGWVHIMSDVTDRKELQENLNQSQKMEAVGRLAGGVAHDFNNILSVIISFSNFVLQELPEGSPYASDLQQIKASGERAAALTRQLLAFSRKQVVNPEVINVSQVINNLSKMLKRLIGEHIRMDLKLAGDTGNVFMDPSQLEQVLVNLTVNARDAMPSGGQLSIGTWNTLLGDEEAEHHGVAAGDYVVVTVRDTGTGMSKETMSKIFEPFFTTKPKGRGTGLGLSMVYGAVKQGNGYIDVASEVGKGTTFTVYLRRYREQSDKSGDEAPVVADLRGNGETILLVEDDDLVRLSVYRILTGNGYKVLQAANAAEALELYKAGTDSIRAVLTDIVMPGMTGVELGRKLQETSASLPVLYMTGYSEEALAEQNVQSSRLNLISKPFRPEELMRRLKETMG
jgi:PAS domain S-box-containing protein